MALLAIHAAVKGKFIELNDLLFVMAASGKPIDLTEVAIKTGIDLHELQTGTELMNLICAIC